MEELPKTYIPASVEPELIDMWIRAGAYKRSSGKDDCTITIPPPNVTGMLHIGHALDDTIQDTIIRYKRMQGFSTRWILGTDHAGIATQTKVDKRLKEQGISRLEMGREAFVDACWDWTREYGGIIVEQIKRMGCSVDFDDPKFTMDPDYARAVRKVFCDWYHDGLIYRGKRIVNWCPNCTTAISDDEAEYRNEDSHLWHLRYPLTEPVDGRDYIVVATTRPETMLGDTGVAVSPNDPSKAAFIGKTVMLPIVNREIPIFADWHVDANFGSGFVKVTPAHDPNDYAMGQAHGLPQINIFDEHAHVVEGYGDLSGMTREEARVAVVKWFEEHGLLDHIEDHNHSVMHCYRCDSSLEPWLSEQWFVAVDKLKGPATDAVVSGKVNFHPQRWTQTYFSWMENLKDWCISRQLWWGHRIPVFYCTDCGWEDACTDDVSVCPSCGSSHVIQDENVLDTWFSSQLWTFATQGWPDDVSCLEGHHPTYALVTARDIIALWVARMVMSSLYFLDEIPFHDVVIYPTILAKDGSRMSKSKGNGVDPMDLIDMYGADAMRFGLLGLVTTNQDVRFDADIDFTTKTFLGSERTENAKAFVTKIYNASRFVLSNLDDDFELLPPSSRTCADTWIFSRLGRLLQTVPELLDEYLFADYVHTLYSFFWNEFCDWYIECSKDAVHDPALRAQSLSNLIYVLDRSLRLLHPVMPFITEYIWDRLPHAADEDHELLINASWPLSCDPVCRIDDEAEAAFEVLRNLVSAARSTRARYTISPKQELALSVRAEGRDLQRIERQRDTICRLARLSSLVASADLEKPAESVMSVAAGLEIYVHLSGLVDLVAERARLTKQLSSQQADLSAVEKTLSNPSFMAKAAQDVIASKQERAASLRASIALLEARIHDLD